MMKLTTVRCWLFALATAGSLLAATLMPGAESNWELMRTAIVTGLTGGDPYLPSEVQQRNSINLSFPYNPVWLPSIAAMLMLGKHELVLFAVFLAGLFVLPRAWKDRGLAGAFALGLFVTLHSGNAAALEFLGMCFVFRLLSDGHIRIASGLLGVIATMKLLPVTFALGFSSWRARGQCLLAFLATTAVGLLIFPGFALNYARCVLGLQGQPSVVSELRVAGMDNQAVYQHGLFATGAVILVVVAGLLVLRRRFDSPCYRLASTVLGVFLLWPRIPPHAFLAYAAVPVLALYQDLEEWARWGVFFLCGTAGWLLVCRSAGADQVPATTQYWLAFAVFALCAFNAFVTQPASDTAALGPGVDATVDVKCV